MHANLLDPGPFGGLPAQSSIVTRWGLVIVVLAGILMAWFAGPVLMRFPHSGDEYAYQYQARTFLQGRVVNPPAPDPQAFTPVHIVSTPEAMYSKYPPGWPMVLAVGEVAGAGFLVNPILAALSLWVLFGLARRTVGDRAALAGLALLTTNSMFLLNGASFFSHPLAGLCMALAMYGLWRFHRSRSPGDALFLGAMLGALALARPQDGIVVSVGLVPLALIIMRQEAWSRRSILASALVLGPVILGAGYLLYNRATTGDPLLFGHTLYDSSDHPQWHPTSMIAATVNRLQEYLVVAPAGLAALFLLDLRRDPEFRGSNRALGVAALVVALFWLGYAFYIKPDGGPRFGPRYLYPAHLLILFLAGVGLSRVIARRHLGAVVVLLALFQLGQTAVMSDSAHQTVVSATGLARAADALEEAIAPAEALILVDGPAGSVPSYDLIRNSTDYRAPVLRARAFLSPEVLLQRWRYRWDGLGGLPVLTALDPRAPVQMLVLTEQGPILRGPESEPGWVILEGTSDCHRYLWEFPGSRPPIWAEFGPCAGTTIRIGWPPGPSENWVSGGAPRRTAQYRTFLLTESAGRYTLRLRANGAILVKADGRVVVESVLHPEGLVLELGIDLDAGLHPLEISFASLKREGSFTVSILDPAGREVPADRFATAVASGNPERD